MLTAPKYAKSSAKQFLKFKICNRKKAFAKHCRIVNTVYIHAGISRSQARRRIRRFPFQQIKNGFASAPLNFMSLFPAVSSRNKVYSLFSAVSNRSKFYPLLSLCFIALFSFFLFCGIYFTFFTYFYFFTFLSLKSVLSFSQSQVLL